MRVPETQDEPAAVVVAGLDVSLPFATVYRP